MIEFNLFGIPVRVQPWFWVTMALLGGATGANSKDEFIALLFFIAAGFISILVHELGHAITGKSYGSSTAITLHGFGGYVEFPGARFTRLQDFIVTIAGPAVQLILGLVAWVVFQKADFNNRWDRKFIEDLMEVSLFWSLINLIPVLPLDGGRLLNALMGPARIRTTLVISMVAAVGIALLMFIRSQGRQVFFPLFLASFAWQNWQMLQEMKHRRW